MGEAKIPEQKPSLVRLAILNPQSLAEAPAVVLTGPPLNLQRLELHAHKAIHHHQNPQPQKQDQQGSSPQAPSLVYHASSLFVHASRLENDMNRDNPEDDDRYHQL